MAFGLSKLKTLLQKDITQDSANESVLGIDIGSSAIKFVQIHKVKNVPTLETYGELQLGPYEGVDIGRTTHLAPQKLAEALSDILKEAKATSKKVVYSLSYGSSFTSTIRIPTLDVHAIDTMLPIEARKYIPISLSKVTLDWVPIESITEEKATKVLMSAVYNEAQADYEKVMTGNNLTVLGNEIEIFSTIRSAVSPADENVVVIDAGASATRLYIVEKGIVTKTHSVPLSGALMTKDLSTELGIDFDKAEEMKRELGLFGSSGDAQVQKVIASNIERGIRELHTVVRRHIEQEKITLQKVILSGGGALLRGSDQYIRDIFSLPVEIADPFAKVAYPAFLEDTLKVAGSSFAVALGVALRGFQLSE